MRIRFLFYMFMGDFAANRQKKYNIGKKYSCKNFVINYNVL